MLTEVDCGDSRETLDLETLVRAMDGNTKRGKLRKRQHPKQRYPAMAINEQLSSIIHLRKSSNMKES